MHEFTSIEKKNLKKWLFFSERADPNFSDNYKGRLKEGANINRSLVTLGNVIKALGKSAILYFIFLLHNVNLNSFSDLWLVRAVYISPPSDLQIAEFHNMYVHFIPYFHCEVLLTMPWPLFWVGEYMTHVSTYSHSGCSYSILFS